MFEARAKVDRRALGFTPVSRDASIRLEQGSRNHGYDAMLYIDGKTSRTMAFRSVESRYEWIGEQETFEGPRKHKTVDGEFPEAITQAAQNKIRIVPRNAGFVWPHGRPRQTASRSE
jgi:hypothetical protein